MAVDIADIVIDTIGNKKMEITITKFRGMQAKLASMFPSLASNVVSILRSKGIRNQQKLKSGF